MKPKMTFRSDRSKPFSGINPEEIVSTLPENPRIVVRSFDANGKRIEASAGNGAVTYFFTYPGPTTQERIDAEARIGAKALRKKEQAKQSWWPKHPNVVFSY